MRNKIMILVLLLIVSSILLISCGRVDISREKEEIVAKVNGEKITKEEFDKYFEYRKREAERSGNIAPEMWVDYEEQFKSRTLDKFINQVAVMQELKKRGINVETEEIEAYIEEAKELLDFKTNEEYEEYLMFLGLDEEQFKKIVENQLMFDKFRSSIKILNHELNNYFNANKEDYIQVKVRHIILEDKEEAEKALKELKAGADFAYMAESKSIGSSAENGGDLGYLTKFKQMEGLEKIKEVAFKLNEGDISDIIETKFGYHIVMVEDIKNSFFDSKDMVKEDLINQNYSKEIDEILSNVEVEVYLKGYLKEEK